MSPPKVESTKTYIMPDPSPGCRELVSNRYLQEYNCAKNFASCVREEQMWRVDILLKLNIWYPFWIYSLFVASCDFIQSIQMRDEDFNETILVLAYCKLKAFLNYRRTTCIKRVYLQIPKGRLTSASTVCYRMHSEILFATVYVNKVQPDTERNSTAIGPHSGRPACVPTAAGT